MLKKISILFLCFFISRNLQAANLSDHFWQGSGDAFTGINKWLWLTGGALTLIALNYDQDIYHHYLGKKSAPFPDSIGDVMGTGIPGATIAITTLGVGWLIGSKRTVGAGQAHGEALIATFIYTALLKIIIERDRSESFTSPSEEDQFNSSFPSGHTSTAFATAGSIMAACGPWLGIPFLALAGLTGYSRIQQKAHYTADVIFGATLGYTMGLGFYKHHKKGKSLSWNIHPYFLDRNSWGIVASKQF